MNRAFILIILLLLTTACGGKGATNDTQIGDDDGTDGGGETEEQAPNPTALDDNGLAEYCVDRGLYHHLYDMDEVLDNEYWYHPLGRSYEHHLDISDKPSPMSVTLGCSPLLPHFGLFAGDAFKRGGSPSCMSSGYHLQVPWVGTSDYIDPGHLEFPYSRDIITGTVGNPPQSGRHTWMAPACCGVHLTDDEVEASAEWQFMIATNPNYDFFATRDTDCAAYVAAMGVHDDAMGYQANYNKPTMLHREMTYSTCVTGSSYSVGPRLLTATGKLGTLVPYHTTRRTEQYPSNVNYDYAASLGLIKWSDFAAFGMTIDALIKSLLEALYLPPSDFQHARYKLGGGCHFPTAIRWSDTAGDTVARLTCPIGYYADFGSFSENDPDYLANGLVGTCQLDGVDGGTGLIGSGEILSPATNNPDDPDGRFIPRHYVVLDELALALALEQSAAFGVTPELASEIVDQDGNPFIAEGATIEWWSSPWTPLPIGEAMKASLGYDVEDLMAETGWSFERAAEFVDGQGIVAAGSVVDGLSAELSERMTSTMRSGNLFHARVNDSGVVHSLHFSSGSSSVD